MRIRRHTVKLRKQQETRFRTLLRALRDECPVYLQVNVRRTSRPGKDFGWTYFDDERKRFCIYLRTNVETKYEGLRPVTFPEIRDTLMHEWAHVMAWAPDHPSLTDHDASWGIRMSQVYQAVVED